VNELLTKSSNKVRLGLALASMSTVLLELILTRIFSASVGYHFAFMIVSMTMFGMTAGALYAFARPPADDTALYKSLSFFASLLALSIPLAHVAQSYVNDNVARLNAFAWIGITFLLYSVIFFFAGTCVCLCLTRFREVGKLYAADLIGAGISCPLLIIGLTYSDPQWIISAAGLLAALAAACFALEIRAQARQKSLVAAAVAALLCLLVSFMPPPLNALRAQFGQLEYIKWSPLGRVVATTFRGPAVSWAKVNLPALPPMTPQKGLFIDFGAFTVMTGGSCSVAQLKPIERDVTALGNRLRPGRSLFVIGVGGGRDVLTGLLYGQKRIDGVEVNPAIVDMLKKRYAEFNGHLAERPGVNIVNDEARNWLARSRNQYGIIQCSLVDTWSASASGAFMLTENVLYTKEAFESYIRHIDADGILCFLRWGDAKEPGQILRMLYLAKNALESIGVSDVANHVMLVTAPYRDGGHDIGTMIVSPRAFSKADIASLVDISKQEGYEMLWVPGVAAVEPFAGAITKATTDPGMPSDNRPFFFTPVKPSENESSIAEPAKGQGLALLMFTLLQASLLVTIAIVFPAWRAWRGKLGSPKQAFSSALFFSCLGVAFMLVEVAQVQRLTILLGNPTYGLSVVLFALLLASGAGSFAAQMLMEREHDLRKWLRIGLIISALLILASAWVFRHWLPSLEAAQLSERMAAAIPLVALPGFFMGWAFPLGMAHFTRNATNAGAWYWAINGATSVLASVLAAIISIIWGIQITLIVAAVSYLIALASLL
jgi:hypothetical protein